MTPREGALVAVLILLVAGAWMPLAGYYFSQDDFQLIYLGTQALDSEMAKTFGPVPHHVRPLTKYLYFAITYPVFGLNPTAYHIVSLLMHLCNVMLVLVMLRRLRLDFGPALIGAALFGLNVGFFHAVGWISCVQQLAGTLFMLTAMALALRFAADGSRPMQWLSLSAYALALLSVEQTFIVPLFVTLVIAFGLAAGVAPSWRGGLKSVAPHYALMLAYLAMRLWKGVPDEGRTRFVLGQNVAENVSAYAGTLYEFWPDVAGVISLQPLTFKVAHAVLVLLVAYHLVRRRPKQVLVAAVLVGGALSPALFLVRHYFYYHTYAASLGALYLLALALQNLARTRWLARFDARRSAAMLLALMAGLTLLSGAKIRAIAARAEHPSDGEATSFVIRRAVIAERFCRGALAKKPDLSNAERLYLLWGAPGMGPAGGRNREVMWALGNGYAANVTLGMHLEVAMQFKGVSRPRPEDGTAVLFYDHEGNFYLYDEVVGTRE